MKYLEYKNYFFVGIGGIGMSALAKYLYEINKNISGYDKVESSITQQLCERGIGISYIINESIKELQKFNPRNTLIIYTPAISNDNKILK